MATILLQDAQDEIERQLSNFASGLNQARQSAVQVVQDVPQRAAQSVQQVQQELSNFASGLQQQVQVLPDVAGGAIQQLAPPQGRDAVLQTLTDYANQLVQPAPRPQVVQPQPAAGAAEAGTTGVVSLPHTEEPASATDVAPAGGVDNLASRWKTQFDFGATYTGAYRTGTPHRGVDLVPADGRGIGAEVQAFTPGTVTLGQRDRGAGGLMVYVEDAQGLTHAYMHLQDVAPGLQVGQRVERGTPLARMGESGTEGSPHLHYEVRKNAASGDPLNQLIDPRPYLRGGAGGETPAARAVAAQAAAEAGGMPAIKIDASSPEAFIRSITPAAQWVSQRTGIPADAMIGMAANETGYGKHAGGNNLFGIKGEGPAGSFNAQTWEDYGAGPVTIRDAFRAYHNVAESFQDFADLVLKAPRYAAAKGQETVEGFVGALRRGGYMTDPNYVGKITSIVNRFRPVIDAAAAEAPAGAAPTARAVGDQQVAGAPTPSRPVMLAGDQAPPTARQPIYGTTMIAGEPEGPLQRGLTLAQDVAGGAQQAVAGAAGAVQQAAGGVQQQAQQRIEDMQRQLDELRAQLEPYNQPPLAAGAPARRAIEQAAGGVAGAIAEPGRQIRAALEPEAGYSELPLGPSPGGGRVLGAGPPAFPAGSIAAEVEAGRRDVRTLTPGEGAEYTAQIMGAGVPGVVDTYRALSQAKREAIEQGNPLRDAFFVGGLTSAVADAVADPITWALPWARVANMAAGVAASSGLPLISGQVGGRIAGEALMNGLQNAALEMAQRDATPERVGIAFLAGAGFGGGVRGIQETPVAREIGRQIMDQRGRGWPALQQFLRDESGELDVDAIVARGTRGARPAAPEAPTVPPTAPEPFRAPAAVPEPEPAMRMYHGTGAEFETPEPGRFAEEGLFGPGYYLTSEPRVAGGIVSEGTTVPASVVGGLVHTTPEGLRGTIDARIARLKEIQAADPTDPRLGPLNESISQLQQDLQRMEEARTPGRVVSMGYAQQRGTTIAGDITALRNDLGIERQTAADTRYPASTRAAARARAAAIETQLANLERGGPNVRAVDVPQTLKLLNVDERLDDVDRDAIAEVLHGSNDPRDVALADQFDERTVANNNPTGKTAYDTLANVNPRFATETLARAGFDGISYEGGQRIPMTDAAGRRIEHQATVIFPESLPKIRNAISGRQGGQAQAPFALNVGGAALGGYAGYAATPEGAEPEEYLRNIGLGATTGLLGARGISRLGPGAFARAGRAGGPPEARQPFRAPGGPELRAATQEPPGGPPARPPRTLGEVHSNRYTLREAGPDETPLTDEELGTHYETLERRLEEVQSRSEAIDEMLRNPGQKVQRPPWSAGYTNVQLAEIARRHGTSPYTEYWWEPLGLEAGSGEVRYDVGESGVRSIQTDRELTPTELRREQRLLEQERQDILAAADQLGSAGPGTRFAPREAPTGPEGDLPFDSGPVIAEGAVENAGPSGNLAEDIVTRNRTSKRPSGLKQLWTEPGQVVGQKEGVIGRGVADADTAGTGEPSVKTAKLMPNLDAMLGDEMPEVRAQIQKAVEDNPELFEAYNQQRISHDSLFNDLAQRVGMTKQEWLKTPVGKGFSNPELIALQAAAIDAQGSSTDMAREILDRGGVDNLTDEEVAFGLSNLFDTTRLLAVARGARATQGRGLNALKRGMDRRLARDITGSNETRAARREAAAARRGAVRASRLLDKTRDLELEGKQAVAKAREAGMPRNVWEQIQDAYDQLDRYNAMTLHEKADDFNALAKERAERAAARKAKVREAPEELLSALRAELAAERKIFAGRKNTWETMAFWDSKAAEIAAEKRRGFRGGLYIEQQRKAARLAEKANEERARQAWDAQMRASDRQQQRAATILEHIGGAKPSRDLLRAFTEAVAADDDGMVAAKFLKGLSRPQTKWDTVVEAARSSNIMRLAGMLSSTATHLINSGGNVIQVPLEVGTRQAVVGIDVLRSAVTGGERQAYQAEILPMLKAWGPGFLSQWDNVKRQLTTGISPEELADLSTLRPGFRSQALPAIGRVIPERVAQVADPTIEMPLRTLKASDIAFRGAAFAMQAQRVAVRQATREGFRGAQRTGRANDIVANLEDWPELYREAAEQAARMVYQERRTVPGLPRGGAYGEAEGLSQIAVSQVVPFRFTPANIFAQGFGLSPAGLLGVGEAVGRRGAIEAKVATGELPRERLGRQTLLAEERVARAAIGTGILAMGYMLGSMRDAAGRPMGKLTAMYDEDEASTYPQGWRGWSMRQDNPVNGETVYVPLQNFGAAGLPLAMAALLTDAERRGRKVWEGDEIMRAVTGLGRYAIDNTFLQGVSDWVDLLHDPARSGGKFVEGLAGSYGPYSAMGRQIQRAQGVASRNPREGWLGLLDALEANYPGVSANVPEATTPLGEPRTPGATGFGALVGRYDIERDNPTLVALRAAGVDVPREPKVLPVGRGYGVELTESERDQLKRMRGSAIIAAVEKERAKPRVQEWERALQTASPESAAYRDALARYNGAMRAVVSGAASGANADFQRRLGRDQVTARMKITREIEPAYIGPPAAPVGELEAVR